MLTSKYSSNPFLRGTQPKRFLADRKQLMKENRRVTDLRVFNPEWNKKQRA